MRVGTEAGDDSGFTLIEVVVAMVVFTVLAAVTLGLLVNTTNVASGNIHRTAATNLVNSQLELTRSLTAQTIPDGRTVSTQVVGGITYTITQNASYVGSNAAASVCSGTGDSLAYKLVTVLVTWPTMGNIKPVRGDTLRAVGVGSDGLDSTKGTLAVSIVGSTGQPTPGVVVSLNPGSINETTGDDGCVVFTGLVPATYTASASSIGYVGTVNTQAAAITSLGVTAGDVARGTLLYDTQRSLNVLFDAPVGAIVPANLPLRIGDSYVPESTLPICAAGATSACTTAVPGTINNLFPESYAIKAGSCTEATPSQASIDLRPVAANGSTVTVPVGAVTVKVVLAALPTVGILGRTITFSHAAQATGCTAGESYTMTSVVTGSTLVVPYGAWTVSVPVLNALGAQVSVSTGTVTLSPAAKTGSLVLVVAL